MSKFERVKKVLDHTKEALAFTLALGVGGTAVAACGSGESHLTQLPSVVAAPSITGFAKAVEGQHQDWRNDGAQPSAGETTVRTLPSGQEVSIAIFAGVNKEVHLEKRPFNPSDISQIDIDVYPKGTNTNPNAGAEPQRGYIIQKGTYNKHGVYNPNGVSTEAFYSQVEVPTYLSGKSQDGDVVETTNYTIQAWPSGHGSEFTSNNTQRAKVVLNKVEQQALAVVHAASIDQDLPALPNLYLDLET
ncbi:MAG TPA: hypothetical protein VIH90_05750 [Candidatus Saccharimonadales bacterium]